MQTKEQTIRETLNRLAVALGLGTPGEKAPLDLIGRVILRTAERKAPQRALEIRANLVRLGVVA